MNENKRRLKPVRILSYIFLLTLQQEVVFYSLAQSNFSVVQKRGRMRDAQTIEQSAATFPCHYIVFDLLKLEGKPKTNSRLHTRKQLLAKFFEAVSLPTHVDYKHAKRMQAIDVFEESV